MKDVYSQFTFRHFHLYTHIFLHSHHSIQDLGLGIKAHYSFQLPRQGNRVDSSLGLIVVSWVMEPIAKTWRDPDSEQNPCELHTSNSTKVMT